MNPMVESKQKSPVNKKVSKRYRTVRTPKKNDRRFHPHLWLGFFPWIKWAPRTQRKNCTTDFHPSEMQLLHWNTCWSHQLSWTSHKIPPHVALAAFFGPVFSHGPAFSPFTWLTPTIALPILRIGTLLWYVGRSGLLVVGDRLLGGGGRLWVRPLSAIALAAFPGGLKQRKRSSKNGGFWNANNSWNLGSGQRTGDLLD